jgi:apolipoprotein N-acyltransferase
VNDAPITRSLTRIRLRRAIKSSLPSPSEASLVTGSALLTVLSFPNFDLWFLAWVSLVPLLTVIARGATVGKAFVAGWVWGTIFFYGTCWWLTFPMIHYAGISVWLAYPLLLIPIVFVSVFPALACAAISLVLFRFGSALIFIAPVIWAAFDWLRYVITGLGWNSLGYSQAFHPILIQPAAWGGIYAVTFLVVSTNAVIVFPIIRRTAFVFWISAAAIFLLAGLTLIGAVLPTGHGSYSSEPPSTFVIAVQPNVPMNSDSVDMEPLLKRHLELSNQGLLSKNVLADRLVIWPESPMNFSYSRDPHLRKVVGDFARANQTSVLLNSLEPGKSAGDQNSAILVNEKGEMSARYDKIRLMPFGEYVPLPRWLPGASSVRGLVGEFEPGSSYTLMPLGALRAGVFICIEAAHPGVARNFTNASADVLINISNDGYLGPTAVMRQHLGNAVFRAVENDRDVVRVTNSGITAYISSDGAVHEPTTAFHEDVRTWTISKGGGSTFYSRHGDVFVYGCGLISLGFIAASFIRRRESETRP